MTTRQVFWATVVVLVFLVAFPVLASADNCGSTSDCWATAIGGMLGALGLGGLAGFLGFPKPDPSLSSDPELADLQRQGRQFGQQANRDYLNNLVKDVNPGKGKFNCGFTSTEVNNRLGGGQPGQAPVLRDDAGGEAEGGIPIDDVARWNGEGSFHWEPSIGHIQSELQNLGDGSRGIVFIDWGNGTGHVFNAINQGGTVYFVDGQPGTVTTDPSGYDSPNYKYKLDVTYPPP